MQIERRGEGCPNINIGDSGQAFAHGKASRPTSPSRLKRGQWGAAWFHSVDLGERSLWLIGVRDLDDGKLQVKRAWRAIELSVGWLDLLLGNVV
ncbi:hypothetical protein [Bradyrhizobium sp. RDI18]|uniref:hypothetical protein n=1 Tax=Bradyrhizobium sp. RDI18 TaxID=3367400 RepID=UPI003712B263